MEQQPTPSEIRGAIRSEDLAAMLSLLSAISEQDRQTCLDMSLKWAIEDAAHPGALVRHLLARGAQWSQKQLYPVVTGRCGEANVVLDAFLDAGLDPCTGNGWLVVRASDTRSGWAIDRLLDAGAHRVIPEIRAEAENFNPQYKGRLLAYIDAWLARRIDGALAMAEPTNAERVPPAQTTELGL